MKGERHAGQGRVGDRVGDERAFSQVEKRARHARGDAERRGAEGHEARVVARAPV